MRADGSGVGGVTVVVNELGEATISDNGGNYRFSGVPAGDYNLSLTLGDNAASEAVTVNAGETATPQTSVDWDISFAETITVVSASRRAERIVEAPSAVTLVTTEEIERQASHGQLPKLLEFTPGAEVTQSGIYDYNVNTRGFNSSLNRRVATLVDGRDVSVPFLGAQEWAAVSFPLDDIQTLELVRGPSAALYGANASSGVLNMVTKAPKYSHGGVLRLGGGELSTTNVDLRWATELASDWHFKLVGGLRNSGDFTQSRNINFATGQGKAEYAVPCLGGLSTDCLPQEVVPLNPEDDNEISFYTLRLDKHFKNSHVLTLEGGQASIEGPAFQTGIGRVQLVEIDRPSTRINYNTRRWNFLAYNTQREAPRQTALASGGNVALDAERTTFEVQTNWDFADGKARVVVGASSTEEDLSTIDPRTGLQTLMFEDVTNDKSALFAQLDWNVSDNVKIVLAGRSDENDLHSSQFSPKASLVYSIDPNNTLRFTYNEAFQVANYSEFFLQANVAPPVDLSAFEGICAAFGVSCGFAPGPTRVMAVGNPNLDLEEIKTIEAGYSGILGDKLFLTFDVYSSENENFITDLISTVGTPLGRINSTFGPYTPPSNLPAAGQALLLGTLQAALGPTFFILSNNLDGTPILAAVSYTNFGEVDTTGADLGINYYINDKYTFSFSYSYFDFDIKNSGQGFDNILLPNTPEGKGSIGLAFSQGKWDWNVSGRWVDTFRWAVGPFQGDVKSYTTVDLTANYQVSDHWKLGLNVANAFDDEHWESFGGDLLGRRALGSIEFSW